VLAREEESVPAGEGVVEEQLATPEKKKNVNESGEGEEGEGEAAPL
jgi:hypothetical protein